MSKRAWIIATCALAVAACAGLSGRDPKLAPAPDVLVWAAEGKIVVDPYTIRFSTDKKNIWVVWAMRDPDSGYRFNHHTDPNPGIRFKTLPDDVVNCHQRAGGREYACFNIHRISGRYEYAVNLHGPSNLSLDPVFIND